MHKASRFPVSLSILCQELQHAVTHQVACSAHTKLCVDRCLCESTNTVLAVADIGRLYWGLTLDLQLI